MHRTDEIGPLVSVITPTLNRARLLEFTLRSVSNQTYRNVEHIVVDGGSSDETVELLNRYSGSYRLSWTSESDRGMYAAINKGLGQAKGNILAYLNSDDLYFPWTLEAVVERFTKDSAADVVFGDALTIEDATGVQRVSWGWPFDLDYIRRYGFLVQPTVFWRRRVFDEIGPFDESLRYVADCDYWMRAGATHRFTRINEFLAVERDHASTLRASDQSDLLEELRAVRSRYVVLSGGEHRRAMARHAMRVRLLYRAYWLRLTATALLPATLRKGGWKRLLASGTVSINVRRVGALLLPRRGARFGWGLLRPSRYWLEPGLSPSPTSSDAPPRQEDLA